MDVWSDLFDLDDEADFRGSVQREGGSPEGDAGMLPGFTKNFEEQIGGAVDDLGQGEAQFLETGFGGHGNYLGSGLSGKSPVTKER